MLDAERPRDTRDTLIDLDRFDTPDARFQREFEILADGIARIERILLQHKRHVALGGAPVGNILTVDEDLSARRLFEPGNQPEGRRLAGARLAEQHEKLSVGNFKTEIPQGGVGSEGLGDAFEFDMRHQSLIPKDVPVELSKKCA